MFGIMREIGNEFSVSQRELSEQMGESPVQISRWVRATDQKPLVRLMQGLRNFAKMQPERWLLFLSKPKNKEFMTEMENVFFFTEDFTFPNRSAWLISDSPAELENSEYGEFVIDRYIRNNHDGVTFTYWASRASIDAIISFLEYISYEENVSMDYISKYIRIIESPELLHLLPIIVFAPDDSQSYGLVALSESPTRSFVLTQPAVANITKKLRVVDSALKRKPEYSSRDGFTWSLVNLNRRKS